MMGRRQEWADQVLDCIGDVKAVLAERFDQMQTMIADLAHRGAVKDFYTTAEVAALFGKDGFTVREWCRLGRIHCHKKLSGRGRHRAWVISHDEVLRIQREGLLPLRKCGHSAS